VFDLAVRIQAAQLRLRRPRSSDAAADARKTPSRLSRDRLRAGEAPLGYTEPDETKLEYDEDALAELDLNDAFA
jgi:hypothetical protein